MQRARAILVAWMGSGSCQTRPRGLTLINHYIDATDIFQDWPVSALPEIKMHELHVDSSSSYHKPSGPSPDLADEGLAIRIRKIPVSNLHAICVRPDKPYTFFSLHLNARMLRFDPRPVRVGFVVDTVALGHVFFFPCTSVSSSSIIPQVMCAHISHIYHNVLATQHRWTKHFSTSKQVRRFPKVGHCVFLLKPSTLTFITILSYNAK
jgi:hypothetical protein